MNLAIDTLIEQETVTFAPVSGVFDVTTIAAAIEGIGFSFRDEADPTRFVITSDARSRDTFQARRRTNPPGRFPFALLVRATPEEVSVWPISTHVDMRELSVQFLEWLTTTYDCRVSEETGPGENNEPVAG